MTTKVIIRDFVPLTDSGFIFSTMPKSIYYSGINIDLDEDKKHWFEQFYTYLQNLIPESEISIACLEFDLDTIIGYCIVAGRTLQFVYIKEAFRKQGIARLLVNYNKQIREVNIGFVTRIGDCIIEEHKNFFEESAKVMTPESIEYAEELVQHALNEIEEGFN